MWDGTGNILLPIVKFLKVEPQYGWLGWASYFSHSASSLGEDRTSIAGSTVDPATSTPIEKVAYFAGGPRMYLLFVVSITD